MAPPAAFKEQRQKEGELKKLNSRRFITRQFNFRAAIHYVVEVDFSHCGSFSSSGPHILPPLSEQRKT